MRTALFFLVLLTSNTIEARWKLDRKVDEVTDSVTVSMETRGNSVQEAGWGTLDPNGDFRISCQEGTSGKDIRIAITLRRFGADVDKTGKALRYCDVQLRFGKDKVSTYHEWYGYNITLYMDEAGAYWQSDTFICPDEYEEEILNKVYSDDHRDLLLRVTSPFSHYRFTLRFDIRKGRKNLEKIFAQCRNIRH